MSMLQARYTQLLNYNNFCQLTIDSKINDTNPQDLDQMILKSTDNKDNIKLYVTIVNYCKSLILNPSLSSFNFKFDDIMEIWEIRLITMILLNFKDDKIVSDNSIQFEVKNILYQLGKTKTLDLICRRFRNLLNWIRYKGTEIGLISYYYSEIFLIRAQAEYEQSELDIMLYSVLSVLDNRGEYNTIDSLIKSNQIELEGDNYFIESIDLIINTSKSSNHVKIIYQKWKEALM